VTAHLEPEVMIIDEVLAVGDAQFQKKCMNKILSAAKDGRTILFVSHSMDAIKKLCDRAILLEKGRIKYFGDSEFVSDKYLGTNLKIKEEAVFEEKKGKQAQFLEAYVKSTGGEKVESLDAEESWVLYLKYKIDQPCEKAIVAVEIMTQEGQTIYMTSSSDMSKNMSTLEKGTYDAVIPFGHFHFIPGTYHIRVSLQTPGIKVYDTHESTVLRIRNNNISEKIEWNISKI
jgi:lipopolysaccharide transport system ATP-binding protein